MELILKINVSLMNKVDDGEKNLNENATSKKGLSTKKLNNNHSLNIIKSIVSKKYFGDDSSSEVLFGVVKEI